MKNIRRDFLKQLGMLDTGSLLATSPWLSTFDEVDHTSKKRCRIAVIGSGARGRFLMSFMVKIPKIEIVALYDIYEPSLEKSKEIVSKARIYHDNHKLQVIRR